MNRIPSARSFFACAFYMTIRRWMLAVALIACFLFLCDNWSTTHFNGTFPLEVTIHDSGPDPIEWVILNSRAFNASERARFLDLVQKWKPESGAPIDPIIPENQSPNDITCRRYVPDVEARVHVHESGTYTSLGRTLSYGHAANLLVAVRRRSGAIESKVVRIPDPWKTRHLEVRFP